MEQMLGRKACSTNLYNDEVTGHIDSEDKQHKPIVSELIHIFETAHQRSFCLVRLTRLIALCPMKSGICIRTFSVPCYWCGSFSGHVALVPKIGGLWYWQRYIFDNELKLKDSHPYRR